MQIGQSIVRNGVNVTLINRKMQKSQYENITAKTTPGDIILIRRPTGTGHIGVAMSDTEYFNAHGGTADRKPGEGRLPTITAIETDPSNKLYVFRVTKA